MKVPYLIEATVDSLEAAVLAEQNGAHQIELCSRLDLDGLTPDFTLIKKIKNIINIPVKVMIRPRGGNFAYNDDEEESMIDSISKCRYIGVDGVVIGAVNKTKKTLDIELIEELCAVAYPIKVTMHKAIDACKDPLNEIRRLSKVSNIDSILTSGKESTALEGYAMIKSMINEANQRFTIIVAGKVTKNNLSKVHAKIGANAYHGRAII